MIPDEIFKIPNTGRSKRSSKLNALSPIASRSPRTRALRSYCTWPSDPEYGCCRFDVSRPGRLGLDPRSSRIVRSDRLCTLPGRRLELKYIDKPSRTAGVDACRLIDDVAVLLHQQSGQSGLHTIMKRSPPVRHRKIIRCLR